jgi:transketolase
MAFEALKAKIRQVTVETLKLHKQAPETRIASSLSAIEILVALYYGDILRYDPHNTQWEGRDRFIASKGHGTVAVYPILADLGFFDRTHLAKIGTQGALLGVIPDANIPGIETTNGSLGHGPGVGCGMAVGLKAKGSDSTVFVLCGDGEINSGAVWEAVMFAAFHHLNNLILIIDNNGTSMLGRQKDILGMEPLEAKFSAFGWIARTVDGHDIETLCAAMTALKKDTAPRPKVLIANTIKGKGVPSLENDPLCHVKTLKAEEIDTILGTLS